MITRDRFDSIAGFDCILLTSVWFQLLQGTQRRTYAYAYFRFRFSGLASRLQSSWQAVASTLILPLHTPCLFILHSWIL